MAKYSPRENKPSQKFGHYLQKYLNLEPLENTLLRICYMLITLMVGNCFYQETSYCGIRGRGQLEVLFEYLGTPFQSYLELY